MSQVNLIRTIILDSAESLFADAGFDTVGIRDVSVKAGVPLGLIGYHFHTKKKLYEAVIARRSDKLNAHQLKAVEELPAGFKLRHVVEACLRPQLQLLLSDEPGWRSYGRLLAQTGQQQRNVRLYAKHFRQSQDLILEALTRAESRLTKEAAARGYAFMLSVMFGMLAKNDLLSTVSGKAYSGRDLEPAYAYAVSFLTGAFEKLSATEPATAGKPSRVRRKQRYEVRK